MHHSGCNLGEQALVDMLRSTCAVEGNRLYSKKCAYSWFQHHLHKLMFVIWE